MPLKNKIVKSLVLRNIGLKVTPIVGQPKFLTTKTSELIDALLKHFLKHAKSYILDIINFLIKCGRNTDRNTVIATFDVTGLYTIIPHTFGIKAVRYLKNNTCAFDNKYLLQLQGTAMGTVFAPTCPNITVGYHEIKLTDLN